MPASSRSDWEKWLDAIERDGVNLTVWEEGFVEDMRARFDRGRDLTPGQADSLERIYAERTP